MNRTKVALILSSGLENPLVFYAFFLAFAIVTAFFWHGLSAPWQMAIATIWFTHLTLTFCITICETKRLNVWMGWITFAVIASLISFEAIFG